MSRRCRTCGVRVLRDLEQCGPCRHSEGLETQADAIIRRGDDILMQEMKKHADQLVRLYEEARGPRNDKDYVITLERHNADRQSIANDIKRIRLVREKGQLGFQLTLVKPRNQARAQELLRLLGNHFEAVAINLDDELLPL